MGTDYTSNQTWLPSILVFVCVLFCFFFKPEINQILYIMKIIEDDTDFMSLSSIDVGVINLKKNNTIKTCEKSIRFLR